MNVKRIMLLTALVCGCIGARAVDTQRVTGLSFTPNAILTARPAEVTIILSHNISPLSVSANTVKLIRAGADGTFGTGDDITITPVGLTLPAANQIKLNLSGLLLPDDLYRVQLRGRAAATNGLRAYYPFDEASGTTAADASGNGNDATLLNGPAFNATGGVRGGALQFDGTDDYIEKSANATLEPSSITVCVWAYLTDGRTGNVSDLIRKADPTNGFVLRWSDSTGKMQWHIHRGGQPVNPPTISITDNQSNANYLNAWHHFAGTFDATTGISRFYVDGVERVQAQGAPGNMEHSGALWMMWTPPGAHTPIPGKLDEARIFDRALSATELAELANPGVLADTGLILDGEFSGTFPSGNGSDGGDFEAGFTLAAALRVTGMTPAPGSTQTARPNSIALLFNKNIVSSAAAVTLSRAGTDETFGTADDVTFTGLDVTTNGNQLTINLAGQNLPGDQYRITLASKTDVSESALNAKYTFNEGTGSAAADSSGNGFNGTINGVVDWVQGITGSGLRFNGSNTFVEVPHDSGLNFNDQDFTIAAWIKPAPADGTHHYILTKDRDTDPPYQLRFNLDPTNLLYFQISDNGSGGTFPFTSPSPVPANVWSHVAVTRLNTLYRLYINGAQVASKTTSGIVFNTNTRNLRIGARYAVSGNGIDGPFNGDMDDVRIYHRALSTTELQVLSANAAATTSSDGEILDGEFPGSQGGFPTGNNAPGGDFTATFSINYAPVATSQTRIIHAGNPALIALGGSDVDGDQLAYTVVSSPAHGTLTGIAPNLIYTPLARYVGSDTFTFRVNDGVSDSPMARINIEVTNQSPTAQATASPLFTVVGNPVAFIGNSGDPDGDGVSFTWDFGDGSPPSNLQNVSHSFAATNIYSVTLTVTDSVGAFAQSLVTIVVRRGPIAEFNISELVGFVGQRTFFDASKSRGAENDLVGFVWNFGDGTTGAGAEVSHVFATPGRKTITLTVTDTDGLSAATAREFEVLPADDFGIFRSFIDYSVKWDRTKTNVDSLQFDANVNVGADKVAAGTLVAVEIAGQRYAGSLDAKLRDKNGNEQWQVVTGTKTQSAGAVLLRLRVKKSSLGAAFNQAGAVAGGNLKALVSAEIPVRIEVGSRVFEIAVPSEFKFSNGGNKAMGSGSTEE